MRLSSIRTVVVGLALASSLAACSTGSTETATEAPEVGAAAPVDEGAFPVTIKHAHGETVIEQEPKRVVTIGWSEHDFVAALGVVPVGASKLGWGGNEEASTPWFDERVAELGGTEPVRYDDADGIAFEDIAKLNPDLILATYWDMSKQDYAKLSKLADVVSFPKAAFTTTWQESLDLVGQALGRSTAASELEADTEALLAATGEEHPELVGSTFLYAGISQADLSKIDYLTPNDARAAALVAVGMEMAPEIERLSAKNPSFFGSISAERVSTLESDVAILMPYDDIDAAGLTKLVKDDKLLSTIPAVKRDAFYPAVDPQQMLSLSAPSPLSLPWAMDEVVPEIAEVAAQ